MDNNKPIDGAEIITLDEIKHLKLPYFEGLAAGYPSPAGDYQHESLDLNEKFVRHEEASYFVRVSGESMTGIGIFDGDICLVDRLEEVSDGCIVVPSSTAVCRSRPLTHPPVTRAICGLCPIIRTSSRSSSMPTTNSSFRVR